MTDRLSPELSLNLYCIYRKSVHSKDIADKLNKRNMKNKTIISIIFDILDKFDISDKFDILDKSELLWRFGDHW